MLQTMSDMAITRRRSRAVPCLEVLHHSPNGVHLPRWLRAVSQKQHVNASAVVHFRVILRSEGHMKKKIWSKQFGIYWICTQRA